MLPYHPINAQNFGPRFYSNIPVGLNFLIEGYAYTAGSVIFDLAVPLGKGKKQNIIF